MTRNTIAFQKGILVTPNIGVDNRNLAMMVQAELMHFGYMLEQDALIQLGYSDASDIKDFHNEVIDYLKEMTGGKRSYQPVYKGFPTQVMEMSEFDLWMNQLIGYYNGGTFTANEWTATKPTAFEHVKYKMIKSAEEKDFSNIFTSLLKSGTSLPPNDMKVINWFLANYNELIFPDTIPFKENLCTVLGILIAGKKRFEGKLPKLTTTDVLRIIVYLSGGNISLPSVPAAKVKVRNRYSSSYVLNPERDKFKFKKFSRLERRNILFLLENSNLDVREMKLKAQRWIRVGEILHPGEFKLVFPKTFKAFQKIRNDKVISWYGEVERAFRMSFDVGLAKLSERPGEFLRQLDFLVRESTDSQIQSILNILPKVASKASNKVIFELYTHFEERKDPVTNRSIMIKGARKKTKLKDLPALDKVVIELLQSALFDALKEKLKELPEMGDCWVDEELKKIPLPTNMRSLNDALVPVVRGQRIPLGLEKKVIRPFIHWFDETGSIDIDLHGFLLAERHAVSFGYNGTHSSKIGCYSGDVRHRRGACAEYVDIVIDEALKERYEYFIMVAHNFGSGKLSDIKECVVGTEEREYPEANPSWLPSTITNSMKVEGASRYCLVCAYDLKTREYIHLDLDYESVYVSVGNTYGIRGAIESYLSMPKVSVYDLLQWHVEARGRLVSKETATTHFLFEDFSSSYLKTIEYMGV